MGGIPSLIAAALRTWQNIISGILANLSWHSGEVISAAGAGRVVSSVCKGVACCHGQL